MNSNPPTEKDCLICRETPDELPSPTAAPIAIPADAFMDEEGGMRRRFTGAFKAHVVLEALEGKQSIQELAERHHLHPNQIRNWKSLFRKRLPYLFEDRRLCNPGRRSPFLMNEDTIPGEG